MNFSELNTVGVQKQTSSHTYSRGKNSLLLLVEINSYLYPTISDMQLLNMRLLIVVF